MTISGERLAATVVSELARRGHTLATCESLTAGLVAGTVASVPGASAVLRGGLITYSTELKHSLAGVDVDLLTARGAVDPQVAQQMAEGARTACQATIGVACTGVAGPDPQDGQPVGRVYIAVARHSAPTDVVELSLDGDRNAIRHATVDHCLHHVLAAL